MTKETALKIKHVLLKQDNKWLGRENGTNPPLFVKKWPCTFSGSNKTSCMSHGMGHMTWSVVLEQRWDESHDWVLE
jgi:hypothetical protein